MYEAINRNRTGRFDTRVAEAVRAKRVTASVCESEAKLAPPKKASYNNK